MFAKQTLIATAALVSASAGAQAQHTIDWYTIDGGGGESAAFGYTLTGTIAQADAGPRLSTVNGYSLTGGFWSGGTTTPACVADVDNGTGTGTPDGGVGIEDLIYYLTIYDVGLIQADLDNGTGTGVPDGGVSIEDLLYFLARYDAGC